MGDDLFELDIFDCVEIWRAVRDTLAGYTRVDPLGLAKLDEQSQLAATGYRPGDATQGALL